MLHQITSRVTLIVLLVVHVESRSMYPTDGKTITCAGYEKLNGNITRWDRYRCRVGNACCFSAVVFDQAGKSVVETGGCEDEFAKFLSHHPAIELHVVDRLPYMVGSAVERITEYCHLELCFASVTPKTHWRICACHEENCNRLGIDEMLNRYMDRDIADDQETFPLDFIERDIQILSDG